MKNKVKQWIINWLEEPSNNYNPKKERDLKAVCFTSYSPIDSKHKVESMIHCTEWSNGEGYDMSISNFNTLTRKEDTNNISLHCNEINLVLAALKDLNYFE